MGDCADNWVLKLGNLHKLQSRLDSYSTEVLNLSSLETLDLQSIARQEDRVQLLSLLENLMQVIINCPCKELYISRIMSLREAFQAKLMAFIQKILDKNQPPENIEEEAKFMKREYQKLRQDKLLLNRQLEEAHRHTIELSQMTERLTRENKELRTANSDLNAEIGRRASPLKGSLLEQSGTNAELEGLLMQRDQQISELKTSLVDQKKAFAVQTQSYKDEVDVANEKLIHLSKVERDLELYKKRLEDLNGYKKKLKEMHEINESLKERLNRLDDDSASASSLKQMLNYYKDQVSVEKEKAALLSLELDDLKEAHTDLQRTLKELEELKAFHEAKIKGLMQEIERANDLTDAGRESEDSFSLSQADFSDQLKRMERHNQALRSSLDSDQIVRQLNEQLDEAIKQRRGAEEKLRGALKESSELKEKLGKLVNQHDDYKLETSLQISEMQEDLKQRSSEVIQLKSQASSKGEVESLAEELRRLKGDLGTQLQESARLYKEKDEISSKFIENNERLHGLQTQIAEKDAYLKSFEREKHSLESKLTQATESCRLAHNELEMLKKSSTFTESPQDKLKCLELERDLMKANGENSNLRLALREKEDAALALDTDKDKLHQQVQELQVQMQELVESSNSAEMQRLSKELHSKEAEIRYLQLAKDDVSEGYNRELKVMAMVVYEVGLDISRLNRHSSI
jgi:myosin protein heavy chain